jgi:hypothetical protein
VRLTGTPNTSTGKLELYDVLLPVEPSAVVDLMCAAAMAMRDEPFAGMESIDASLPTFFYIDGPQKSNRFGPLCPSSDHCVLCWA